MENKRFLIIVLVLFVIGLTVPIYMILRPTKIGDIYSQYYSIIDDNIKIIEENMTEITTDDTWSSLKPMNLDDEKQTEIYNSLIKDVSNCYTSFTDTKNLNILNLKNKRYISDSKLSKLSKRENCLETFAKYNEIEFSDDKITSDKLKGQLEIIVDYEKQEDTLDFIDLIHEETDAVKRISNLTNWLKIQYNSYV